MLITSLAWLRTLPELGVTVTGDEVLLVPDPPASDQLSMLDPYAVVVGRLRGKEVALEEDPPMHLLGFVTASEHQVGVEAGRAVVRGLRKLQGGSRPGLPSWRRP